MGNSQLASTKRRNGASCYVEQTVHADDLSLELSRVAVRCHKVELGCQYADGEAQACMLLQILDAFEGII